MSREFLKFPEIGGRGGGGGKGGGKQRKSVEQPDNLQSTQTAKLVDLISEGPIRGLVTGGAQSIYLDGVRLQNPDGSLNWQNAVIQAVSGWPGQPIMQGFAYQSAETAVSVQLLCNQPLNRTIINPEVDRVRLTFAVPALQTINKNNGDISGATVQWDIHVQANGAGYQYIGRFTVSGKTTSRYQRSVMIPLPGGEAGAPWMLHVNRVTADSTTDTLQNDLFWDSYTEIIDDPVNYNLSACIGTMITADQFNSIPKRTYHVEGLYCLIPNNYDPFSGAYSGNWDGGFAYNWTNNPAWILFDLLVNNRYGLGDFISISELDKWTFYKVGKWCDTGVYDGHGNPVRRWTCNVQIQSQSEAFDLLNAIAAIFRGFTYWSGGTMQVVADQPGDPVMQFTNANVIEGVFSYSSTDIRDRHTQIVVSWRDPELLGEPRLAVVEDYAAVSRYGLQTLEIEALGCTDESQAVRVGKWTLFNELYEGELIEFKTGLETAWCRPGDIVQVLDHNVAGAASGRRGGRVKSATNYADYYSTHTLVEFDTPIYLDPMRPYMLYCIVGEGVIEARPSGTGQLTPGWYPSIGTTPAFSSEPQPDTVWVMVDQAGLTSTLWRVMDVSQIENDQYSIKGVRHRPDKWSYVDYNIPLSEPQISAIQAVPSAVQDMFVTEYLVTLSPISVGVRATVSWRSDAPAFDIGFRDTGRSMNWTVVRTDQHAYDLPVTEGLWDFQVTPVSSLGFKGPTTTVQQNIIGRFYPPLEPQQFRLKISDGVALFEWLPATEIDVIIGGHFELRHSSRTSGASWAAAQVVVPSIPGSATTVEAVYRTGTWFLRTYDIVGIASDKVATIIAYQPDGRYNEFARICENPDWLGHHNFTEVLQPQQWLVLGQTGGIWDDQLANMDDWPDVDVLVEGMPNPPQAAQRHGWYIFEDRIDAGGVFTVRFSADILAFPYQEGSDFIDDRLIYSDDWADWDDLTEDLQGQVQLFIRTTNDNPASSSAVWSNWQVFSPIEYTARGFEFRADLWAPQGQNIGVEELCIIADLRMKMDSAEDVPYPAQTTHVTFKVKFYLVPSVVITVQDAESTDTIQVTSKTREGFDLTITNAGAQVTRVFDWQARGY